MTDDRDIAVLAAAIENMVIPADEWPGGWEGGTAASSSTKLYWLRRC